MFLVVPVEDFPNRFATVAYILLALGTLITLERKPLITPMQHPFYFLTYVGVSVKVEDQVVFPWNHFL